MSDRAKKKRKRERAKKKGKRDLGKAIEKNGHHQREQRR
jgi:hypothetical protein